MRGFAQLGRGATIAQSPTWSPDAAPAGWPGRAPEPRSKATTHGAPSVPPASSAEPAELVELYLRGDEQAQREIDAWLHRAASPFRRGLGEDWFDVLQDVRLEVMRLLRDGRFRGESSLKTYLWKVAAHTCLDALRRQRRRPIADQEPTEDQCAPHRGPSPLQTLLDDERQTRLLTLLAQTSEECRAIWRLVLAGATYGEAARQLGVSEGTLRVRAHRCRKRVAEELSRNAGQARDAHE